MTIPVRSFYDILLTEALHPFFCFQYFAIIVWSIQDYWIYAIVIFVITVGAIYITTQESHANLRKLRELARIHSDVELVDLDLLSIFLALSSRR